MKTSSTSPAIETSVVRSTASNNPETIEVFRETARTEEHDNNRQRLSAHNLFSSFTAGIIQENTLFTR